MSFLTPLGKFLCKAAGWRWENAVGDIEKCVIIAAPHTSNWDLPFTLSIGSALDLPYYFLAKHTLWEGNWGWFFDFMHGIPVDRRSSNNVVDQIVDFMDDHDRIALVIAPEGTRSKSDHWKSGFYHIARQADVPIVLGYLDFENKRGGLGRAIYPIGTQKEVMDEMREFYRDTMGKRPELFIEPRLRNEDRDSDEEIEAAE